MANLVEILITGKNMSKEAFAEAKADGVSMKEAMLGAGAVAGAALVAVGVEAVKMASNYQLATTRLVTSASEQRSNLKLVQDGMLAMAGQVGIGAQKLAEAMYYVEAAGYHGADGLKVLQAAAEGAVTENADVTDVSKALTDVLVDYHLKASAAADVTSKMVAAISHGKVNLEDFSKAFASIVPAASAAGISFNDVGAALAEMTNHGFTAQRASQNLAQALRSLLNPTTPMTKEFDKLGGSMQTLHDKLNGPNGLTDAMNYASTIAERAGKVGTPAYAAALKLLMGTAAGANAALATTGENSAATTATIQAMAGATADASGKVAGFALVQNTFGQQVRQLDAGFQSLMIGIGMKLLPVLTKLMIYIGNNGSPVMKTLGDIAKQYVVPVMQQWWQILQNLYPVAVSIFQVLGGTGYASLVAVSTVLKDVINPALIAFTGFLKNNQGVVQGIVVGYLAYKTAVLGMEGAIFLVETATKAWTAAQWLLNIAMDANPVGITIAAVGALATGIFILYNKSLLAREIIAEFWSNMGAAASLGAHLALVAIQQIQDAVLGFFEFQADAAVKLFGWIPGVGGQVKSADASIHAFAASLDTQMQGAINTVDSFNNSMKIATQTKTLTMQIGAWTQSLNTAKAQLASVPASKRAALLANIADLTAKIDAAKSAIDSLHGKTVTIYYNGVVEGYQGPGHTVTGTTGFNYAAGGVVSAAASGGARSGMVLVGEQGPELVKLPTGSSVTPAGGTRRMLAEAGSGGETRIVLEFTGGDANLLTWLRNTVRIRGGNVQTALGQGY
ncbi:TP901 family phage tail tape measure protein [Streptacidiphilus sp. MAP12-33]|uniref:phage tail tape measure protein n=1 Tax=Streptacidiphilus sp. MAP12-33 TaxID=3156266 RepID=UPI003510D462